MLLRHGGIPSGDGWAFELKYDGFRAIVSTEDGLQVRSRRAWNMTERVPDLRELPPGLVLDGELVAFNEDGAPHWPLVVERVSTGQGDPCHLLRLRPAARRWPRREGQHLEPAEDAA
jgi:ATP-dependent DNA ligase